MPRLPLIFPVLCAGLLVFAAERLHAQVIISELMAQNVNSAVIDEDGEHSDWIELQNTGASAVDLNGWYLTDNASDLRQWRFPVSTPDVTLAPGERLVVWCSNKDRKALKTRLHTNFKLEAQGEYLALVQPDGFTVEFAYAPKYPPQFNNSVYGYAVTTTPQDLVTETASGKAKVAASLSDFSTNFPGWNSSATFNTTGWQDGQSGFGYDVTSPAQNLIGPLIGAGGNVQAMMYGQNSSCFVRYIFNVASPTSITALSLKVKYDDGFICYLNGTAIASSLAPGGATWNSAAIIDRSDGAAPNFETASLVANAQNYLVSGNNVLAFQMLNSSASDTASLLRPQLIGSVAGGTQIGYLASPTPGTVNSTVVTNFGPAISQITDAPVTQPVAGAVSFKVTAKVVPTLRPLAASNPVMLKYRVMYTPETSAIMYDDGPAGGHGDATGGDSIYTGTISTTLTAGQMLRWRVEAKDNGATATYSYEPAYPFAAPGPPSSAPTVLDSTDIDQYFGTMAINPAVNSSLLPVLNWFVDPAVVGNTRSTTGASCSFYYLGKFYDNVRVELHGQSSSGFPVNKKSHNINFTKINRFEWNPSQPKVRGVNLLTTYADKTKVRNSLAWEAWALSGHIMSHWSQQTRVEQNGAFWGIYDMVEDGNEDLLDRYGYNSFDALYKIYDPMNDAAQAEQKTREDVDTSKADYTALLNGLNTSNAIATRRQYSYDNVDISAIVNALAVHALINNNDWGHKNFYMFRNTTGTGEWSVLPWDQDLSSGHTWEGAAAYWNDEIDSQRGIRNGASNRLKQVVYDSTEMNRMFVRRMRTLMDQFLISGTSTAGWYETRVPQLLDLVDPSAAVIGAGVKSDQQLDFEKWGFWLHGGGGAATAYTNGLAANHTIRAQASRMLTPFSSSSVSPFTPYPGFASGSPQATNTTWPFAVGRRRYLYNLDLQNPASGADAIPTAQATVPTGLTIEYVDANPTAVGAEVAALNNEREFFIIRNNSGVYVDISGWKITGAVNYTFHGGTVIPPFTSGSAVTSAGDVHAGRLHVARNPAAFRAKVASPHGNEYRLVVGPYEGQISARGEAINLVIPGATPAQDVIVATTNTTVAPTATQNSLRVTELNYAPSNPTAGESSQLPGVQASDFEFIELTNTSGSSLALGGATFDKGITFTFPAGFSLASGARCVVVSLPAAYTLRYNGAGATIAGQFEGNLDNDGERIRLIDAVGEEVLDFTYDPAWYPPTATSGYSLVTRSASPAWDGYDASTAWAISASQGGTPGTGDTQFSTVFEGWRHDFFTALEEGVSGTSGLLADPDGDGDNNLREYAFGRNPRVRNTAPYQPTQSIVNVLGNDYLAITFERRKGALDVTYSVQASGDLNNQFSWTDVNLIVGTPTDLGNGMERVTYRDNTPVADGQRFLRVKATK